MLDNESITIHFTKIVGQSYPDDHTVIWRGLPIGRIRKNPGLLLMSISGRGAAMFTANHRSTAIADWAPIWRTAKRNSKSHGRGYAHG